MKATRIWRCVLPALVVLVGSYSAHGATTLTWDGAGVTGGTGSAFWDNNTVGNWNAGSGANANFNNAANSLDFGSIAVGSTYTLGTTASTVQTISANNLYFGDASTQATDTTLASNIILNGDNGGVAQTTPDVTLSLAGNIYVAPPGATVGTGPLVTLGADIDLSLSTAAHSLGLFAPSAGLLTGTI